MQIGIPVETLPLNEADDYSHLRVKLKELPVGKYLPVKTKDPHELKRIHTWLRIRPQKGLWIDWAIKGTLYIAHAEDWIPRTR